MGECQISQDIAFDPFKDIISLISFSICCVFLAFPDIKFIPLGRAFGPLCAAGLLILFQVITPSHAALAMDFNTLNLLLGMMIIAEVLAKKKFDQFLCNLINSWEYKKDGNMNIPLTTIISSVLAVLLTNDGACVFMHLPIAKMRESSTTNKGIVLLLAVCTSANIGSALGIWSNPQQTIIASVSGLNSLWYSITMFPSVLLCSIINSCALLFYFYLLKRWIPQDNAQPFIEVVHKQTLSSGGHDPAESESEKIRAISSNQEIPVPNNEITEDTPLLTENNVRAPRFTFRNCNKQTMITSIQNGYIAIVIIIMVVVFFVQDYIPISIGIGWTALSAAILILISEVIISQKEPNDVLKAVDWELLIMFGSLFIVTDAINRTGYIAYVWNHTIGNSLESFGAIVVFGIVISAFSNTIGNVPIILLAAPIIPCMNDPVRAWMLISWFSTISGNLTLLGSAANLIVAERARLNPPVANLNYIKYFFFGFPTTIINLILGAVLILIVLWIVPDNYFM